LPVESSDLRYFIRARPGGPAIYRPENASVRRREAAAFASERFCLLTRAELPGSDPGDGGEREYFATRSALGQASFAETADVDLYGHLYSGRWFEHRVKLGFAQCRKAWHLRWSMLCARPKDCRSHAPHLSCVPLLSTPCDLYAFGVLAVRTFLVNPQTTLAVALDDVLSLARTVGKRVQPRSSPALSNCRSHERGAENRQILAPNRLVQEAIEPMTAFELLPPELWHHTLATIIRFFPGIGPDSYCKGLRGCARAGTRGLCSINRSKNWKQL
jgi:hypothetical protein